MRQRGVLDFAIASVPGVCKRKKHTMGLFSPDPVYHSNGESFTVHWCGKGKFLVPMPGSGAAPPPSFAQNLDAAAWQDIMRQRGVLDFAIASVPGVCKRKKHTMGLFSPDPVYHSNGESFTVHWCGKGKFLVPMPGSGAAPPPSFAQNLDAAAWQDIMRQLDNTFVEPTSGCCSWDAPNAAMGQSMRDSLNTQFNPRGVAFSIDHFWSPSSWKFHTVILFRKIPPPAPLPVHPAFQMNSMNIPEAQLAKG
eukprot:CAMPEP_0169444790 /NCGR_PEP_ID=MMETSP1042-20121227/10091_1 /TAXON_ID=464988 /ORGANISM="Hemiselmis andersenii, Strain CCMP1180" /LENGTH=249 /DNA_ID=CAMNT_0009556137 /DNA_START=16 /DNA_END=765 /DNA_ORIENTATION=-